MIIIATSLYYEAQPFIEYYHLKKDSACNRFQVFRNDTVLLIITGTGPMNAAIAVTYLCTLYPIDHKSILLNVGICGINKEEVDLGTIFLCNKILNKDSGRSFYPDILYVHPFWEAGIITSSLLFRSRNIDRNKMQSEEDHAEVEYYDNQNNENVSTIYYNARDSHIILFDMEASGIFQAASVFMPPHQLFFLKIVSDHGKEERITGDMVVKLVYNRLPEITDWISKVVSVISNEDSGFTEDEIRLYERISADLKLTQTMENQFRKLLKFSKVQDRNIIDIMKEFYNDNGSLQCKSKSEGKRYFEQLKGLLS